MLAPAQGCVLVFVPGVEEIRRLLSRLRDAWAAVPFSTLQKSKSGIRSLRLLPLHAGLSHAEQQTVFEAAQHAQLKVVVCTNVAEVH